MNKITNGKTLIIGDVHQDIGYVERILQRETNVEHYIFLGDYFDTHENIGGGIYGVGQTCDWINSKREEWGGAVTWLLGNHDCAYLASYKKNFISTKRNRFYSCSGWTRNKAKNFSRYINADWLDEVVLCAQVGDFIVSHSGFNSLHFNPYVDALDNIKNLYDKWQRQKHTFMLSPNHWIWDIGYWRGGSSQCGSPIWMDWDTEFVPIEGLKQIVGHTSTVGEHKPIYSDKKLPNYNIDCMQTCYAVWDDGQLEIKYA